MTQQSPMSFSYDTMACCINNAANGTRWQTSYDNRDQILFAIDCGPDMHKPEPNGQIPIKVAFDCVKSVTMSKIFAGTSDRLGVLLYNTVSHSKEDMLRVIDSNEIGQSQ